MKIEKAKLSRRSVRKFEPALGSVTIFEAADGASHEATAELAKQITDRCAERGNAWDVAVVCLPLGVRVVVIDPEAFTRRAPAEVHVQ